MDDTSLAKHLLLLEERLLERSAEDFAILLADDFMEFGSSGRTWNKQQEIDALVDGSRLRATIVDFRARRLAPDVVLATYRLVEDNDRKHSLRSSIWKLNQDKWQMIFHQGTPSEAPPA
ncbi:MAG: DUF4440 domain-containing protein [Bacillota bacterium]|nr:DUF4440 domain-containing protein [Bacillota bacterium]